MSLATDERRELMAAIERDGWAATPPLVPQLEIDGITDALHAAGHGGGKGAAVDLLERMPSIRVLAASPAVRSVAEAVLGPLCFAVRATLPGSVADDEEWRQVDAIAVEDAVTAPGFTAAPGSSAGALVHPPAELLERMLVVRVHLDDAGAADAAIRVLPGSHRVGLLSREAIGAWRSSAEPVACVAERGAIVALRPLLVHAPSVAASRVVHLEFAAENLPDPLGWRDRVA